VFGKRNDPVELSVDGDCCTGDLCNHVGLTHGSTGTTMAPLTGLSDPSMSLSLILRDLGEPVVALSK
jgi:hypothetical protein